MKQCPKCNSLYSDESLRYCLTDGTELVYEDPARTEILDPGHTASSEDAPPTERNAKVRIDLTKEEETPTLTLAKPSPAAEKRGISGGLVAAIVGLLVLVIAVLGGFIGYVFYQQGALNGGDNSVVETNSRDAEVERLKQRIDELGNRLSSDVREEPGTSPTPETIRTPDAVEPEYDEEVIKRVNSPADGFLALRDRPDSRKGSRVAKIPHGDIVVLGKCQENTDTIGGRTGHWCRAKWEGYSGWVFDVWLTD